MEWRFRNSISKRNRRIRFNNLAWLFKNMIICRMSHESCCTVSLCVPGNIKLKKIHLSIHLLYYSMIIKIFALSNTKFGTWFFWSPQQNLVSFQIVIIIWNFVNISCLRKIKKNASFISTNFDSGRGFEFLLPNEKSQLKVLKTDFLFHCIKTRIFYQW